VNVNAPSVRTSLVCGCHFSVAAVIAYAAFFPLHVSTACSDRYNNNNTNAHFGYVHHLNNRLPLCNELIRGRAFSTTLRKLKGTVFDPKGIEQLDYMNLHTIT
jgi:hypothetical protein